MDFGSPGIRTMMPMLEQYSDLVENRGGVSNFLSLAQKFVLGLLIVFRPGGIGNE